MTQKSYHSIEYLAQEFKSSIEKLLEDKTGGSIKVKLTHTLGKKTGHINYSLSGISTAITLEKRENDFYLTQITQLNSNHETKKTIEEKLKLQRVKTGRLSKTCLTQLANKSFSRLKTLYKNSQKSEKQWGTPP